MTGHSFVHRYRRHLRRSGLNRQLYELDNGNPLRDDFSAEFGIDRWHPVNIFGYRGLCANSDGLGRIREDIYSLSPDLVIMEIGTNDLVDGTSPSHLHRTIETFCLDLFRSSSVRAIVLCQIVERRRTRGVPRVSFDWNRLDYNNLVQQTARNDRRIYVFKHDRSIIVNLNRVGISSDDIHVTSLFGLQLYHLSIRRAVITGMNRLRELYPLMN